LSLIGAANWVRKAGVEGSNPPSGSCQICLAEHNFHKRTGQAVDGDGHDDYLDTHGAEYDRRIAEWLNSGRVTGQPSAQDAGNEVPGPPVSQIVPTAPASESLPRAGGVLQYRWCHRLRSSVMADPQRPADPPLSLGVQRQLDIYLAGLAGRKPAQPLAPEELEAHARTVLPPEAYIYVAGGAGREDTVRANRDAFGRWAILPRLLRDVSRRDLGVSLLGRHLPTPLLVAPVGVQSMLHPDAELAVARAARSLGAPMVLSSVSSTPLETVAQTLGDTPRWFQLYWPKDPALAASLIGRAERAGFEALVVTLDTYLLGWRERDLQPAWLPFAHGLGLANYLTDPVFRAALPVPPEQDPAPAVRHFLAVVSNAALTWGDLDWLRRQTRLPILLKGILHPGDARRAVDHGAAGVIVSNHGGRQVDGAVASLDALPAVVEAVAGRALVLFDGGIRRGADVVKALALGARAVLVGRPYCWGLAVGGEQGVREVLLNLLADFELTLALAGCSTCAEVGRDLLVEQLQRR
jgi:isopentenyl diphosphate isomerase/L-lactate dehydrogenase-like FMN-dependent dehydrogenase